VLSLARRPLLDHDEDATSLGLGTGRRLNKLLVTCLTFSVVFLVLNLLLALGQSDFSRTSFTTFQPTNLRLEAGSSRSVFLSSEYTFRDDVRSYEVSCLATEDGSSVDLVTVEGQRLLTVWHRFSEIGGFVAPKAGTFQVTCEHRGGKLVDLVVAKPPLFLVRWASPWLALYVLILVAASSISVLTLRAVGKRILRFLVDNRTRERT
jgi:hypothetical protein